MSTDSSVFCLRCQHILLLKVASSSSSSSSLNFTMALSHALSDGNDVFVWLPTGFGKSIYFQALPLVYYFDYKLNLVSTV